MPNYNTSTPSPSSKNTINSVTVGYGIRDFLLNLNLLPQYPQISTSLNGSPKIGEPVLNTTVGTGNVVIPIGLPLETNGILFKDLNIIYNTFQNNQSNSNSLTEINTINAIPNSEFPTSYWPQGIQSYPTSANDDVEQYGIMGKTSEGQFRRDNTIKNLYLDSTKQIDVADFINLTPNNITKQINGYMDEYGGLNLGGSGAVQAANVIGSIISGQGLGFSKSGVVPNFDIRSSLAGRVLGATGIIKDTKLGNIGGQQLALALANNAAFNVQQELLGGLNVSDNILSLVKGDGLAGFRPSYKITIPETGLGRVLDTAGKILGFTIPRSYLSDSGSLFQSENGGIANIERANEMIVNTGKGQVNALLNNVRANQIGTSSIDNPSNSAFRTGYAPAYANNKRERQITDGILYAFSNDGNIIDLFGTAEKSVVANISYNREQMVSEAGFVSPEEMGTGPLGNSGYEERKVSNIGFSWTSTNEDSLNALENIDLFPGYEALNQFLPKNDEIVGDKKSILVKTQKLFNDVGMRNIVTKKGDMNKKSSQIQTANGKGFSKGNAVLKAELFNEFGRYKGEDNLSAEDTYCRSWTTLDRYDRVGKMVRSHGLWDEPSVPHRFQTKNSVLDNYGFAKIAPYQTDVPTDPKKFMFSIENLAWHDNITDLPECERGPGDLISGKKGRIMWFPPYNINFSESNSVSWESNNFIGRGEPVYTYNNTERAGNLSFQVIVDHPSYVNSFRGSDGPDDHYINSFWAGCIDPNSVFAEKFTVSEKEEFFKNVTIIPQKKTVPKEVGFGPMKVYFPNDNSSYNEKYENGLSGATTAQTINYAVNLDGAGFGLVGGSVADTTQKAIKGNTLRWTDRYNYGLNFSIGGITEKIKIGENELLGYYDTNRVKVMGEYLTQKCPHCIIEVTGYASKQGIGTANLTLADKRANTIIEKLKKELTPYYESIGLKTVDIEKRFKKMPGGEITASTGCPKQTKKVPDPATDSLPCKKDRYASVKAVFSEELALSETEEPKPIIRTETKTLNVKIKNRFYTECGYFEQLTDIDPLVFDRFRDKIRYFHPAFHSTTPEGLNSRLTFLLQCTRQGRTLEKQGANNLAFGRPPVCILRIGDFYNTKIVMDSVNIDYEPLVWDLNPEGIGVQPMIANVTISFKFLGGSTLMGPINKLQNALSFNYFANTQVYDPRADYIASKPKITSVEADPNEENGMIVNVSKTLKDYYIQDGITNMNNPERTETIVNESVTNSNEDQVKASDTEVAKVVETPQSASTSTFTLENIESFMENFSVGKQGWVRGDLKLKLDANNQVIKPTKNFQIDMYLVHEMVPKNGATYDNCAKACPSDLVISNNNRGDFIGSVLLTPEGVKSNNSVGKDVIDPYTPVLDCTRYIIDDGFNPGVTPLEGRATFNNLVAQVTSTIACNVNIQNQKPANERNYYFDKGFRLKMEIKDLTGSDKKTITLTSVNLYEN